MSLWIIVAASDNGVIGADNKLPWHLPNDLKRFKKLTMGHPIVMGRLTYQSIGKALPGRDNYILTCNHLFEAPDCDLFHSPKEVVDLAASSPNGAFVIGGERVYELLMPLAQKIYLTRVHVELEGDAHFRFDAKDWELIEEEAHPADPDHDYPYTFQTYQRKISD